MILDKLLTDSEPNAEEIQSEVISIFQQESSSTELRHKISQLIQAKNQRIQELEKKMAELTQQVAHLKNKIVTAYLHFAPEKGLFQELINCQLDFTRSKKWSLLMVEQRDKFNDAYAQLRNKLRNEKEVMEQVEVVLRDCEELVDIEWILDQSKVEMSFNKNLVKELEQRAIILNVQQGGNVFLGNQIRDINQNSFPPQIINEKLAAYQEKEAELTQRINQLESLANNITESQLAQLTRDKQTKQLLSQAVQILQDSITNNYQLSAQQTLHLQSLEQQLGTSTSNSFTTSWEAEAAQYYAETLNQTTTLQSHIEQANSSPFLTADY